MLLLIVLAFRWATALCRTSPGAAFPGRITAAFRIPLPEEMRAPFTGDRLPAEDFPAGRARRNSFRQQVRRREGLPARPPFSGGGRTAPVQPAAMFPKFWNAGAESEGENVFLPLCRSHIMQIPRENQAANYHKISVALCVDLLKSHIFCQL